MSETYGMISFSGVTKAGAFYEQIASGRKTQTMRKPRSDGRPHVKVDHWCPLYWKVRSPEISKPVHSLGYALITAYEETTLLDVWFNEENAKADGFEDLKEFREWFYPEWFNHPPLHQEAIKALNQLPEDSSFTIARSLGAGKTSLMGMIDYLNEPICVIKWRHVNGWKIDPDTVQASTCHS